MYPGYAEHVVWYLVSYVVSSHMQPYVFVGFPNYEGPLSICHMDILLVVALAILPVLHDMHSYGK